MGTLNKIFTGVKDFFQRKDKPKPNIKMINEVREQVQLPNQLKTITRSRRRRKRKFYPRSFGVSPFKFSRRCSKDWLPVILLFILFSCKDVGKNDYYKTYVVSGTDTVIMDSYGNTDVSKTYSTHGWLDTVNKILYIEIIKPKSVFIPQGLWETSNEGYLVKRDTIFLNLDSIPSGTSISGEGVDKSIIKTK